VPVCLNGKRGVWSLPRLLRLQTPSRQILRKPSIKLPPNPPSPPIKRSEGMSFRTSLISSTASIPLSMSTPDAEYVARTFSPTLPFFRFALGVRVVRLGSCCRFSRYHWVATTKNKPRQKTCVLCTCIFHCLKQTFTAQVMQSYLHRSSQVPSLFRLKAAKSSSPVRFVGLYRSNICEFTGGEAIISPTLFCPRLPQKPHQSRAGRASYNRVIDDQHMLTVYSLTNCV